VREEDAWLKAEPRGDTVIVTAIPIPGMNASTQPHLGRVTIEDKLAPGLTCIVPVELKIDPAPPL
jgi:hypothetical protein